MKRLRALTVGLKPHDRIFYFGLAVQAAVLFGLAIVTSFYFARDLKRSEQATLIDTFKQFEVELTESVVARKSAVNADPNAGNPAPARFRESLASRGLDASAVIARCSAVTPTPNGDRQVFALTVGESQLDFCLVVDRPATAFGKIFLYAISAVVAILLIEQLLWYFFQGQLESRVLAPLLREIEGQKVSAALGAQARQVAHDIRSPLAALETLSVEMRGPEEHKRLLLMATQRIQKITSTLLDRNPRTATKGGGAVGIALVGWSLRVILAEKMLRPALRDFRFRTEPNGLLSESHFVALGASEFERVLSNLVENAIEAEPRSREVVIEVSADDRIVEIKIREDGKGIPGEVLAHLGDDPMTYDRSGGTGVGLYAARRTIVAAGGDFSIASTVGVGTTVTVRLPRAVHRLRIPSEIVVAAGTKLVIVDDDRSQREALAQRFRGRDDLELVSFDGIAAFDVWQKSNASPIVLFMDYDLGTGERANGLEYLEANAPLAKAAYLHTSHFLEPEVLMRCERLGVGLVPKGYLYELPVRSAPRARESGSAYVLIDDDALVHQLWGLAAKKAGLTLYAFASIEAYEAARATLGSEVPIYCDENLGPGEKGSAYLCRLHERGHRALFLLTGDSPAGFANATKFTVAEGKSPPWLRRKA